jgi:signal transduction histidine kinase
VTVGETRRDVSFSAHAIAGREMMLVNDTHSDPRFSDNPLVTGVPHIRFWAGMPILSREGIGLGALSVVDRRIRHLSSMQRKGLRLLAHQLEIVIEMRRRTAEQLSMRGEINQVNNELLAARDEVQRADRVQSAFLSNMSHELETPLNGIIEFTQKIVEAPPDETRSNLKPSLRKILVSARHMLRIITELLELARIDAGKVVLVAEFFNVYPLF